MLPVVISDAIHNFRAALDYIVFELAREDSGHVQSGTQFLIEDIKSDPVNPKRGFDGRSKECLKGLSPLHVRVIEGLQPYHGVDWTKTLRDISNPDKHRQLTVLSSFGRAVKLKLRHKAGGKYGPPGRLIVAPKGGVTFATYNIEIDAREAIVIAPSDPGKPALMTTLRVIETEVGDVIKLFKPEFKV